MSRQKVIKVINGIADNYHFAPVDGEVKGKYFHNNLVLMALSYIFDRTHLLVGDPGWGKTTASQLMATKFSGLPFELYETLMMYGNPGVFEEKLIARPDYAKLVKGTEEVIWQGSVCIDTLLVDEVSRIPPGTQALLLEGIRTGRWTYLNDMLYEGKKPTFLTRNYRDEGNGEIIKPLQDRIDVVTEEKPVSVLSNFEAAEERILADLTNYEATEKALSYLKKKDYKGFKKALKDIRKDDYLTAKEKEKIRKEVEKIPFDNDANLFRMSFAAEINHSEKYGHKRAVDPISQDTHDMQYAGVNVKHGFSARPQRALRLYSRGLAWLLGHDKVYLDHVRYVLPYLSAHKLGFTKAFKNKGGKGRRTDFEDLHLAKLLVKGVYKNYENSIKKMRQLVHDIQHGTLSPEEVEKLQKEDAKKFDHPLLKDLIRTKIKARKSNL